jgi:RNA 2',3'-cyclic 3'-phosphodiesterase
VDRLFVAVWPPVDVVDVLAGLPRDDDQRVRWTTPDQWHITLRFLGEVDPEVAAASLEMVELGPVDVALGPGVERLGDTTIVVPVRGLDSLADAVRAGTAEMGEPVDPRGFRGHLTLGRCRDGGPSSLDALPIAAGFVATEVALVRSDLHADGARYSTVATHRLVSNLSE